MASKRMSRKSMKGRGKKSCGGKRTKRKGKKKRGGGLFDNMPGKQVKKDIKTVERIPGKAVSLTEKGLDTGVGVVEDIGKAGLKEVEGKLWGALGSGNKGSFALEDLRVVDLGKVR